MTLHRTPSAAERAEELLLRFEGGDVRAPFDHEAHVEVAWAAVRARGPDAGTDAVVVGLRRLTAIAGVPEKFDEALTRRWMALVVAAAADAPPEETFGAFAARHPALLRRTGGSSPPARPTRRTARA